MIRVDIDGESPDERPLPSEAAIAITLDGSTHSVMMATPEDLDDFGIGFLWGDGVIQDMNDIADWRIQELPDGFEIQFRLTPDQNAAYRAKRRHMAGPVGCGLCGVESLEQVFPKLPKVRMQVMTREAPWAALKSMAMAQTAREAHGAMHAAALLDADETLWQLREDIGRHNAVDKIIGAALRDGLKLDQYSLVVTSRVSVDLVIKAVRAGIGTLMARATPSDLAVQAAERWGLRLVAPIFQDSYLVSGVRHG